MIKNIQFCIFFICSMIFSQDYLSKDMVKNKIREVTIISKQYKNEKLVVETLNKEFLNENGKGVLFTTYDSNGNIKKQAKTYLINNGKTTVDTIKEGNSIKYINLFHHDSDERTLTHHQIKYPNDTLVTQIWFKNTNDKDSLLINKFKNQVYVASKFYYDIKGDLVKEENFSPIGKIIKSDTFKSIIEGNCKLFYDSDGSKKEKICFEQNVEVTYYYKPNKGYLYGILLVQDNGGMKKVLRNQLNLVTQVFYYDKKGQLQSEISYKYN